MNKTITQEELEELVKRLNATERFKLEKDSKGDFKIQFSGHSLLSAAEIALMPNNLLEASAEHNLEDLLLFGRVPAEIR